MPLHNNHHILVGVKRRGAEIAELIQRRIEELNGVSLPMMELDITFYRDDLEYVEPENPTPVYSGASSCMNINRILALLHFHRANSPILLESNPLV